MKKIVAFVLAAMMLLSTCAFAEKMPGIYTPPAMTDGQYPIAEEDVKLTFWMPIAGAALNFITNHDENPAYIQAQEDTGVDVEFIHPVSGSNTEAFNLLLNSGNLPDMIQMSSETWYNGGLQAMYDDGIIVDLTPYLDTLAPQYKEVIEYDDIGYAQTHRDGKVLGFYKIALTPNTPYIFMDTNQEWLDEYGMGEPMTIEEYEAYFDWILANKPDVTPVWFDLNDKLQMDLTMGAFDFIYDWYIDGEDHHTVKYWADADGYKDWLTLMNKWYEKGYFSRDFVSLTGSEINALWEGGKLAVSTAGDAFDARSFQAVNLPYMRKAADSVLGSDMANYPVGGGGDYITVITTNCKNVEAAIQFMNYGYTFEGSLPYNFGVEGEAWNWDENGMPKYTELCTNNPDGMSNIDVCWVLHAHFSTRYVFPDEMTIPSTGSDDNNAFRTKFADDANVQNFLQLPPCTLTPEEADERNEIMIQVNTYANEKKMQFITGAESFDNYDAYVEELKALGLDRAIEITQAAADRYFANAR